MAGRLAGAPVFLPAEDVCMVEDLDRWEPYGDGDELPCGLSAVGVPGLTRGEQALLSPRHGGLLFVGDALGTTAKWAPGGIPSADTPTAIPGPGRPCPTCSTSTSRTSCRGTATPSSAAPDRAAEGYLVPEASGWLTERPRGRAPSPQR